MADFCAGDIHQHSHLNEHLRRRAKPTLIVLHHVPQVVSPSIVCLAYRHGIVCEIDIAVVA